jgi:DNA-binding Xre family transcriptional regulator
MPAEMVETPDTLVELSLREEVARQAKGARSWADVARRSGLQATSISHLLAGKVRLADVRLGTVAKLCAALGVDVGDILSVETAPKGSFVRTDRPITPEEFAAAVRETLEKASLPPDWTGPVEQDLGEVAPSRFAERFRRGREAIRKIAETEQ